MPDLDEKGRGVVPVGREFNIIAEEVRREKEDHSSRRRTDRLLKGSDREKVTYDPRVAKGRHDSRSKHLANKKCDIRDAQEQVTEEGFGITPRIP